MKNKMKVIKKKNPRDVAEEAAKITADEIKNKPNIVLGLSTGRTMIPFYQELLRKIKKDKISLAEVKTFNLDEYYGVALEGGNSCRVFMNRNFFNKVNLRSGNINFLDGSKKDWKKECRDYEKKINLSGGIDLQILGIGVNAHIGFNEPGSNFKSKARLVELENVSREKGRLIFSGRKTPKYALTIGISDIMKAKKIVLLAFGNDKKNAVQKALKGAVTEKVPASILKKHSDVTFIVDKAAYGSV